ALLVYDTLLTMGREVVHVWHGGHCGFVLLYCANRYSALLNRVMVILERVAWSGMSDQAPFSALPIYALSGKRLWLLLVVSCIGMVLPAADMV
ncbi:hypothetical protein OH77DRAFT_1362599, partial [Trametes cingulata]